MKKLLSILFIVLSTSLLTAQEVNPEAQRRGWNVPRSEREHYGFGRDGGGMKFRVDRRAEKCDCDCHDRVKGDKRGHRAGKGFGKPNRGAKEFHKEGRR